MLPREMNTNRDGCAGCIEISIWECSTRHSIYLPASIQSYDLNSTESDLHLCSYVASDNISAEIARCFRERALDVYQPSRKSRISLRSIDCQNKEYIGFPSRLPKFWNRNRRNVKDLFERINSKCEQEIYYRDNVKSTLR